MSPDQIRVSLTIGAVVAIVGLLQFLAVILCREWVKNDLRRNLSHPLSIRWRPFASSDGLCRFSVTYIDAGGLVHRTRCWTDWHRPNVTWEQNDVVQT